MTASEIVTFDAPVLPPPPPGRKWDREYAAFQRLLPGLLAAGHKGLYAAVHDGQVIGLGPDKLVLALDAYRRFGHVELLVREVTDDPPRVINIPSVRRLAGGG